MEEFKLVGFIAMDTFTSRTLNHFMNEEGSLVCGSKCKFGWDAHTVIKFKTADLFFTDTFGGGKFWKNHLPLNQFIGCKKCQQFIQKKILEIQ